MPGDLDTVPDFTFHLTDVALGVSDCWLVTWTGTDGISTLAYSFLATAYSSIDKQYILMYLYLILDHIYRVYLFY